MTLNSALTRTTAAALLAALALAAAAPAAEAGHGKKRRYKAQYVCDAPAYYGYHPARHVYKVSYKAKYRHAPRPVFIEHHHGPAPVLAGFLGGLFLGATIGNALPAGYAYFDPYCGERFISLELYRAHLGHHRHPHVVHVIEIRSGRWVDSYHYDGGWRQWDEDWYDCDD